MAQIEQLAQDPLYCQAMLRVCKEHTDVTPFLIEATQERVV
uniref:Uncharacterized protein n=1 Tax=Picea glauca TaxID=3330 RepID=A0A101M1Z8_PICGL|nr:hypothetical protein ABT39_MTgene3991 [Picea glauca]QHR86965.1 hypothetical protein Q903MT_gene974 [Picea sitchensis]